MKIGMVVQRYGDGVDGGAEVHCRKVAERLADDHRVTVLTTCAKDYLSWANHFEPGDDELDGVRLVRFPTLRKRRVRWFNYLAKKLYDNPHTIDAEWRWLVRQGPYVPDLINYLSSQSGRFDAMVFFTYLYFPTAAGLPLAAEKSILVPTAHDEPPLYLNIFKQVFHLPQCIFYNTEKEADLVHRVFRNQAVPGEVVGVGIDKPQGGDVKEFRARHGLKGDYLLYLGRVDAYKGCQEMFDDFIRLKESAEFKGLKLVLAGSKRMAIPKHPDILALGFVSEEDKASALNACSALVMPSPYESLSMVTMEAGLCKKPVMVTAKCEVLAEHVAKSGAGLTYGGPGGFGLAVKRLLSDPESAAEMGQAGKAFVERRYGWDRVLEAYNRVLHLIADQARIYRQAGRDRRS